MTTRLAKGGVMLLDLGPQTQRAVMEAMDRIKFDSSTGSWTASCGHQ